tara:strand:- start:628 stop:729 length:102 start_codon:yes stop_codon:yes gene_type:complete
MGKLKMKLEEKKDKKKKKKVFCLAINGKRFVKL